MSSLPVSIAHRVPRAAGFTLIELLVVVAIIALLIAILLPSLAKARDNAYTVRCAANMHGIVASILMYSDDNNGRMLIGYANGTTPYNNWFWAARLYTENYVKALTSVTTGGSPPNTRGVYYCPKGLLNASGGAGTYPTDPLNSGYATATDDTLPTGTSAITWYQVPTKVASNGGKLSGAEATPFMTISADATYTDPEYQRTMQMIRVPVKMVAIFEACSNNFDNVGSGAPLATSTTGTFQEPRLAGRHGDTQNNGKDSNANFAFFDGHVSKYATKPLSEKGPNAYPDLYFYLQQQQ